MDEIEDHWERGPGATAPVIAGFNHCLAVYGWDLRDALSRTAKSCEKSIATPNDSLLDQIVENNGARAALRVYPRWNERTRTMTLLDAAAALGEDRAAGEDHGIETLVVFLGSNNALRTVTDLSVRWSGNDYKDLRKKDQYTVWRPSHFISELAELEQAVERIAARHVIWCTVPHVTIAADLPRRRPQGRARLALLPVLHAPVDHGRGVRSAQRPPHHRPAGARRRLRGGPLQRRDHGRRRARADRLTGPRLVPARHRRAARPPGVAPLHPRPQRAPGVVVAVPAARAGEGAGAHGGLAVPAQRRPRWAPHGWAVLARRRPPHDGRVRADRAGADQHHAHRRGGVPPRQRRAAVGPGDGRLRPASSSTTRWSARRRRTSTRRWTSSTGPTRRWTG